MAECWVQGTESIVSKRVGECYPQTTDPTCSRALLKCCGHMSAGLISTKACGGASLVFSHLDICPAVALLVHPMFGSPVGALLPPATHPV